MTAYRKQPIGVSISKGLIALAILGAIGVTFRYWFPLLWSTLVDSYTQLVAYFLAGSKNNLFSLSFGQDLNQNATSNMIGIAIGTLSNILQWVYPVMAILAGAFVAGADGMWKPQKQSAVAQVFGAGLAQSMNRIRFSLWVVETIVGTIGTNVLWRQFEQSPVILWLSQNGFMFAAAAWIIKFLTAILIAVGIDIIVIGLFRLCLIGMSALPIGNVAQGVRSGVSRATGRKARTVDTEAEEIDEPRRTPHRHQTEKPKTKSAAQVRSEAQELAKTPKYQQGAIALIQRHNGDKNAAIQELEKEMDLLPTDERVELIALQYAVKAAKVEPKTEKQSLRTAFELSEKPETIRDAQLMIEQYGDKAGGEARQAIAASPNEQTRIEMTALAMAIEKIQARK